VRYKAIRWPEHIGQYGLPGKVFLLWDYQNIDYFTGKLGELFDNQVLGKEPELSEPN
jgi:hypothetical protein